MQTTKNLPHSRPFKVPRLSLFKYWLATVLPAVNLELRCIGHNGSLDFLSYIETYLPCINLQEPGPLVRCQWFSVVPGSSRLIYRARHGSSKEANPASDMIYRPLYDVPFETLSTPGVDKCPESCTTLGRHHTLIRLGSWLTPKGRWHKGAMAVSTAQDSGLPVLYVSFASFSLFLAFVLGFWRNG
jgi:hypothetical protein